MKPILFLLFCLTGYTLQAQTAPSKPLTREQIQQQGQELTDQLANGYQTPIDGWIIHKGDTLQLGQGSRPNKAFVYFYQSSADRKKAKKAIPLPASYAGKQVIVQGLSIEPNQSGESVLYGLFVVNGLTYHLDVERAIKVGELLPPVKYRPSAAASPAVPVVVADELIKLKAQLAAGTITQAEFEAQKKKLLDH